jgi:hypothetical protein
MKLTMIFAWILPMAVLMNGSAAAQTQPGHEAGMKDMDMQKCMDMKGMKSDDMQSMDMQGMNAQKCKEMMNEKSGKGGNPGFAPQSGHVQPEASRLLETRRAGSILKRTGWHRPNRESICKTCTGTLLPAAGPSLITYLACFAPRHPLGKR